MKFNPLTRRMFLQGAGRTLPVPFLVSLLPRELWAQAPVVPRRYVGFVCGYDYGHHSNWFPSLAQPALSLASSVGDRTLRYAPLNSYLASSTAPLSRVFGNHLNQHINSINLFRGLDWSTRIAHGRGHVMGNFSANDNHETQSSTLIPIRTIDQVLRDSSSFNTINRDVAVLGSYNSRSYRQNGATIVNASTIARDPRAAFNYLFNSGSLPESNGTTTTTRHARYDQLSGVMQDYSRIRSGRQISSEDRIALDSALDKISDVQRSLAGTTTTGGACLYKHISTTTNDWAWFTDAATMRAFADVISAAIMCDVTRIFMINMDINENVYDVNPSADFHQGHSHAPFTSINGKPNWQYMGEIQNDFIRQLMAPLLNNLAGANDPSNGRTYLYNSLVHYTVECSQVHGLNSQPAFTAGNAGGGLTSGHYLDYSDRTQPHFWVADSFSPTVGAADFANEYAGVPYNRLFNTILQSLGVPPSQYENPAINQHWQGRSDSRFGAINNGISSMGGYGHWGPLASSYESYVNYRGRQAMYNLHHFKSRLPMPSTNAA